MTKLHLLLIKRQMTNRDLRNAIYEKHGIVIGEDRISKMVNGKLTNIHVNTAKIIADTLGVMIDDVVE
jgi:DNA-binding Xre family transcriptional regulator